MLSVYGTQVGVIWEACHIILGNLLKCLDSMHLEMQVVCPCSCTILHTRHAKCHLQMRSLVLLWYQCILQKATIPGQYFSGLFSPPFKNSLVGLFIGSGPHMVCLPPDADGAIPTSATIQATCLVSEDPGNLLAISSPLNCSVHLVKSSWDGSCLSKGVPSG